MAKFERQALLAKFHEMIARREPIIGGGAGTGLSAKCEEAGGIDLIVIYNSGRYRMAGRGSLAGLLAYGNANEIVVDMAKEVIPVVKHTPVLAGVNGTDPFCQFDKFLANLEETGMGYGLEVDMIRLAHQKDMLTTPYVFSAADAIAMTEAGADIIVPHMGLTTGGNIGAGTALKLEDCVPMINEWAKAAKSVREDVIVLCHGGPISSPQDAEYIMKNCPLVDGFYGDEIG